MMKNEYVIYNKAKELMHERYELAKECNQYL